MTMHELFDGSDAELIEDVRAAFEADAEPYGFDLTRHQCAAPEPWAEYADETTGHRWGGWLAAIAAMGSPHNAVAHREAACGRSGGAECSTAQTTESEK